jgi:hypothetical protein
MFRSSAMAFCAALSIVILLFPGAARASPGGWEAPILLEADDIEDAYYPKITADASGNAIAVWSQNHSIWANRYLSGMGWVGPQPISTSDPGIGAANHEIAMESSGMAVVVWEQFDGFYFNISSARFSPSSGWETPEEIEILALSAVNPKVAIDSSGAAMVIWTKYSGMGFHVFSSWHDSATPGWQAPELVEDIATWSHVPDLAMAPDGRAIAAWLVDDTTSQSIWANLYSPLSGWGAEQKISSDFTISNAPMVSINAEGNAIVAWSEFTYPDQRLWSNRFVQGSGWTGPVRVDPSEQNQYISDLGASGDDPMVIWERADDYHNNITWSMYQAESGWATPEVIATNETQSIFDSVGISVNSDGQAVLIWGEYNYSRADWTIWSRWYDPGLGWRAAEAVASGAINCPEVALGDSGAAFVTWMQMSEPHDIWSSRDEGSIQPPIPEFSTVTVPVISLLLVMVFIAWRRRVGR